MLNNIKEILLRDIQDKVQNYDKTKERLEEIESRLKELYLARNEVKVPDEPIINTKKYSFLEKVLFKRREYLEIQKRNSEIKAKAQECERELNSITNEISQLEEEQQKLQKICQEKEKIKEKFEQIKSAKTIKDLNLSFDQAVTLLKNNSMEVFLDECDRTIAQNESNFTRENDFVLVHKTAYYPTDDSVKSSRRLEATETDTLYFGKNEFRISYVHGRDTVHFTLNGEVKSHFYGNFDKRKYAVIIPLSSISLENLDSLRPEDTFFDSQVATNSGYILCPLSEVSEIQKLNPHTKVIGYKGETVDGFANAFVAMLGYKYERIADYAWDSEIGNEKFAEFFRNNSIKYKNNDSHVNSKEYNRDGLISLINIIMAFIDSLRKYEEAGIVYDIDEFIYALFDEKNYIKRQYGITEDEGYKLVPSITEFIRLSKNDLYDIFLKDYLKEGYDDSLTDSIQSNLSFLLYKLKTEYDIDIPKDTLKLLECSKDRSLDLDNFCKMITDKETSALIEKAYKDQKISDISGAIDMMFLRNIVKEVYKTKEITDQPVSSKKR